MPTPLRVLLPTLILSVTVSTALAGCGGGDASTSTAASTAASTAGSDTETGTDSSGSSATPAAVANDICELVTADEVTGVIGAATFASNASAESLASGFGGNCAWTTDPGGDAFAAGATNLELSVWPAEGMNQPPAEAPAVGSTNVEPVTNGAYFATSSSVLLIRVTGSGASDPAKVQQAVALVPAIQGRM